MPCHMYKSKLQGALNYIMKRTKSTKIIFSVFLFLVFIVISAVVIYFNLAGPGPVTGLETASELDTGINKFF